MNKSLYLPNLLLFFTFTSNASELPALSWQNSKQLMKQQVSAAISTFEQPSRKNWAFSVSRYENEEGDEVSSEERYEPNNDPLKQWSLLKLNGETPTAKQKRSFVEEKNEKTGEGLNIKLKDMIPTESLSFMYEDDVVAVAGFSVHLEKLGDKASKKLTGKLTFNKKEQYINEIQIENNAPFSPVFSAEITDFKMTLAFTKINEAVLPHQKNMAMKGSFAFFTEIDEYSTDTYYNYSYQPVSKTSSD